MSDPSGPLRLAFLGDPNSVHLRRWMSYFAARGHYVALLAGRDQAIEPGLPGAIAVERFERISVRSHFPPANLWHARRSVRQAMARVQPDVVNAHFLTVNGWHAWLSGFHPWSMTAWGSDLLVAPKRWPAVGLLARLTLRSADMIMVNSDALRRGARGLGASAAKTEMIQFGVDTESFCAGPDPAALRARLGLEGRRVVFSARAIAPIYHQNVVIEALAKLPPDVVVVMSCFRAKPADVEEIRCLAESSGVSDRVLMLPEIEQAEMADFYRLANVVVSVPESDSTASVLLEALACERPIVASDLPSVREWLTDLDPALLVPVDDAAATAAALLHALETAPETLRELGARSRGIVLARADMTSSMARVEALYRKLADRGDRHGATNVEGETLEPKR